MIGSAGGLIAAWSFLPWDSPDYTIANGLNLASASAILVVSLVMLWWMKMDNKRRAVKETETDVAGLSAQQVGELDWRHPAFRWKP
jgi:hypothetical protein